MKYTVFLLALMFAGVATPSMAQMSKPKTQASQLKSVRDIDGNQYEIVKIGSQYWFKSNLKVSKYRNGDNIPTGLSNSDWANTIDGAYAVYEDEQENDDLYGKLYNHYAVMDSRGLCPTGWHVPSNGEWNILVKYLDPDADTACWTYEVRIENIDSDCELSSIAGGALKSTATQPNLGGWNSPNEGATNSSGFSARPGGFRDDKGEIDFISDLGAWWSSSVSSGSDAWSYGLNSDYSFIAREVINRTNGPSVRCLKD